MRVERIRMRVERTCMHIESSRMRVESTRSMVVWYGFNVARSIDLTRIRMIVFFSCSLDLYSKKVIQHVAYQHYTHACETR
jgi:hypothetical protein